MTMLRGEDVVFVGLGKTVPSWYRCWLPAYHLGCRVVGYSGSPPAGQIATGNTMMQSLNPGDARVWILQQPRGRDWRRWIRLARRAGAKVLYECDDFLPGVERLAASDGDSIPMTRDILGDYEMCLEECDGAIVSVPYIGAEWVRGRVPWWVCRNGIDTARFSRRRNRHRRRPSVGWFGAAGHEEAIAPWREPLAEFCADQGLLFYNIGHQYEWPGIPETRLARLPFVGLENVPDVLANLDIGIAPWADTPFFRGKSDLRVLEGAAAGVAMVSDPRGYGALPDKATRWADPAGEEAPEPRGVLARMIDLGWMSQVGMARSWVERERDASVTAADWEVPLGQMAAEL